MKRYFTIILLLLLFLGVNAQKSIAFEELSFHSDFEKETFINGAENEVFELLFSINAAIEVTEVKEYERILKDFYNLLEKKKVRKKKPKKAIKTILWQIRKNFLKEYDEYAQFDQIFTENKYNCVTASAIYALTLAHFKIPYEIRELPTHVYIVVAPQTDNIILETTDSLGSLYAINQANFVRKLAQEKLISAIEIELNSASNLYYRYMANEERVIDIRNLAGDLYYNESIKQLQTQSYENALQLINKSLYLHPREHAEYVKVSAEIELASQANIIEYKSLKYVFALLEYDAYCASTQNNIRYYSHQMTKKYLIDNYHETSYLKRYYYLLNLIDKVKFPELYRNVQLTHYKQMDYSNYLREKIDTSICYLDSAYRLAPNDLSIQNLIIEEITSILIDSKHSEKKRRLDDYVQQFPFAKERSEVADIYLKIAANMTKKAFNAYSLQDGFYFLEHFEKKLTETKATAEAKSEAISIAYISVYDYYLDKMKHNKAKEWLEKGLEKAPNSTELLRKKKLFDDYRNSK